MASPTSEAFASTTLVVFVADLDGYAKSFRTHRDDEMARFLDKYYRVADDVLREAGGRIVKFIGDSVLAAFDSDAAPAAVGAALALREAVETVGRNTGIPVRLGVNLHMGPVVDAELGQGPSRRRDIIGRTVNQAFLLGRGPGVRMSEPVYRKLPSEDRTPWTRNKPPAVYVLGDDPKVLRGMGKSAAENAARW